MSTFPKAHSGKAKKRMAGLLAVTCMVGVVGSAALFTDRIQSTATAKAGSLDLQLTQTWVADNAETAKHFAPGDLLHLNYTLTNDSTLAAKVREKFVITSDKQIPADTFRIYKLSDLEKDLETGFYAPKAGKAPIATLADTAWDGTVMYSTYTLNQFVLDGTHADQTGKATATPNTDDSTDAKVYANVNENDHYVILFNKSAVNSVAGAKIGVEYLAEALQHVGTGDASNTDKWSVVAQESIDFITGTSQAVPELTFDPMIP